MKSRNKVNGNGKNKNLVALATGTEGGRNGKTYHNGPLSETLRVDNRYLVDLSLTISVDKVHQNQEAVVPYQHHYIVHL